MEQLQEVQLLHLYFTKGIQQPILLMPMNKNPKEKYKVMKTSPTHYEVKK